MLFIRHYLQICMNNCKQCNTILFMVYTVIGGVNVNGGVCNCK